MSLKSIVTTLVGVMALSWVIYFSHMLNNSDELQSKREWSCMQVMIETYERNKDNSRVIVKKLEECTMAGILSETTENRVWVMLNPEHKPWIKVLPDKPFYLLGSELELLKSKAEIDENVLIYLQTHVKNG